MLSSIPSIAKCDQGINRKSQPELGDMSEEQNESPLIQEETVSDTYISLWAQMAYT